MHRRDNYHKLVTGIITSNRDITAAYVASQEKKKNFDPNKQSTDKMHFKGRDWCFKGHNLEDAPEELRNNPLFVEGYEAAMNLNLQAYDEGFKWFIRKKNLETAPKHYQNNIYWMQGYKDALSQSIIDGIDWKNIPDDFTNEDYFDFNEVVDNSSSHRHR